jgi:ribosomal protein S4
MIKKDKSRFNFIKRYQSDFFGDIGRKGFSKKWCENTQSYKITYKNIKVIDKYIKEKWTSRIERKKLKQQNRGKKVDKAFGFFYRVDLVKLRPKRKRRSFFGLQIIKRQKMRFFATQLTSKKYTIYLTKAKRSISLLKKFFQLYETRFDIFLFRINFIIDGFSAHQLINHRNFMINDKISIFPGQQIAFYDVVSPVNKSFFFFTIYKRLKEIKKQALKKIKFIKKKFSKNNFKNFFLFRSRYKRFNLFKYYINIPSYIEINYRIMSAIFIKNPSFTEVKFPFKIKKKRRRFKKKRFLKSKSTFLANNYRKKKKIIFKKLKIPSLSNKF